MSKFLVLGALVLEFNRFNEWYKERIISGS